MKKAAGYFALLWGSLLVQTLPWGGPRPLALLLAGLGMSAREKHPALAGGLGAVCGLWWAGAAGRCPWAFAGYLALACLGCRLVLNRFGRGLGWFWGWAGLTALGALALAGGGMPFWETWAATLAAAPFYYGITMFGRRGEKEPWSKTPGLGGWRWQGWQRRG